jgi:DNA-binding beta-propeller fold protein YncE
MKKKSLHFITLSIIFATALCFPTTVLAKIEWKVLDSIPLEDKPLDITISRDGATAYILCKKKILLYSTQENKVTDAIPITGSFSQIAISTDGERLLLTNTKKKQISIIQISKVYDIEVGQSPIIGKANAPINVFLFFDYQ